MVDEEAKDLSKLREPQQQSVDTAVVADKVAAAGVRYADKKSQYGGLVGNAGVLAGAGIGAGIGAIIKKTTQRFSAGKGFIWGTLTTGGAFALWWLKDAIDAEKADKFEKKYPTSFQEEKTEMLNSLTDADKQLLNARLNTTKNHTEAATQSRANVEGPLAK
jgi:hypothetical protein